jgi:hypothetical protein
LAPMTSSLLVRSIRPLAPQVTDYGRPWLQCHIGTRPAALPCQKAAVKTSLYRDSKVGGRMEYFVQQLINGITLGSIYGLSA